MWRTLLAKGGGAPTARSTVTWWTRVHVGVFRVNEQADDSGRGRVEPLRGAGGLGARSEWVDLRSAAALTGVAHCDLAWALAEGVVAYSTTRPGHEGVPMVRLADVEQLARR
jgi:hypothetical protein